MKNSRRQFFEKAGAGLLTLGMSSSLSAGELFGTEAESAARKEDMFKIECCTNDYRKYPLNFSSLY